MIFHPSNGKHFKTNCEHGPNMKESIQLQELCELSVEATSVSDLITVPKREGRGREGGDR
jgi:hypothetical protein